MDTKEKIRWKERNPRLAKEEINILDYHSLIMKEIHSLANKYGKFVWKFQSDIVQEGYIGLIEAFNKYDPKRGTFVTLAYLRVKTRCSRELYRHIKEFKCCSHLEDLTHVEGDYMVWADIFPSNEVDYEGVCRLACKDYTDRELVIGLAAGIVKEDMAVWIGTTHKEMLRRYDELREEMIAVCNELYEGNDKR